MNLTNLSQVAKLNYVYTVHCDTVGYNVYKFPCTM